MTLTDSLDRERLTLTAWSERIKANKVLATYITNPEINMVDIVPSGEMDSYFESLGLIKKGPTYELDLINSPVGTVAKAFGFNYDDPAVRFMLNKKTDNQLSGINIASLAAMGLGQMGTLVSERYRPAQTKEIDVAHVIDPTAPIIQSKLFKTGTVEENEIKRVGVLIRTNQNTLRHGYLVTCSDSKNDNDSERLALYAATVKNIGTIEGAKADSFVGLKMTEDNKPAVLILDNSRPAIPIIDIKTPFREERPTYLLVAGARIEAKIAAEPAGRHLRAGDLELTAAFISARQLKGAVQDVAISVIGQQFNAPTYNEGKIVPGSFSIPPQMNLPAFLAIARSDAKVLGSFIEKQAKVFGQVFTEEEKESLKGKITSRLVSTLNDAKSFNAYIGNMVENHKHQAAVSKVEKDKPRAGREYRLDELII